MNTRLFRIAGWLVLLAAAAGLLFAWSGIYNVAATAGHMPWTRWLLEFGMRNSVALRAHLVEEPPPFDPAREERGAGHYHGGCAFCHGAPGVAATPVTSRMMPPPPDLAGKVSDWSDKELFRIVKHGLKYTGMPAWPALERDDEVWAVVAFLRRLPRLGPAEYGRLTAPESVGAESPARLAGAHPDQLGPVACARCHGLYGEGGDAGGVPKLAGQKAEYLMMALEAFESGLRPSGIMHPVAARLSKEEMAGLAQYFGARRREKRPR